MLKILELEKQLDEIVKYADVLDDIISAEDTYTMMWASKDIHRETVDIYRRWWNKLKEMLTDFYLQYKRECEKSTKK